MQYMMQVALTFSAFCKQKTALLLIVTPKRTTVLSAEVLQVEARSEDRDAFLWTCWNNLDLLKMLGKIVPNILPNGGLMVLYRGAK